MNFFTILHDEQNISPSSMWYIHLGYFLARSWAVRLGRRWELAFLVEEIADIFTTNLSMCKFLSVSNGKNTMMRCVYTSHSDWLIWTKGVLVLHRSATISFPESTCLLVSAKTRSSGIIHFKSSRFWDFWFHGACVPWFKTWWFEIKLMWMRIECLCGTNSHRFYLWMPFLSQSTHAPWNRKS